MIKIEEHHEAEVRSQKSGVGRLLGAGCYLLSSIVNDKN